MEEKLVEKVNETSVQWVDKTRRNFLKYLAGGLAGTAVISGLRYLGGLDYETSREPTLLERMEKLRNNPDARLNLFIESTYQNPEDVKKLLFSLEPGAKERYKRYCNFDFNLKEESIVDVKRTYEQLGINIDLPDNPKKFSESDKLAIFLVCGATRNMF